MGSPQQHPGNGMLPWMRQLGQTLHHSTCPYCLIWPGCCCGFLIFSKPRASNKKKRKNLEDLIREREAAREREATEREERRWWEMEEKEEQRERQEQEDRRVREARDSEERRHREAVEREEMRERETRERDERYLALLELIAKK